MRHPTKKQVQKVIDNFRKVLPQAQRLQRKEGCSVNMSEINIDAACGTPMCHGGWYAVSTCKNAINFSGGKTLMAEHLGFDASYELKSWAMNNPEIWGNYYGEEMFNFNRAFNHHGKLTLPKIIRHWINVQKRLPK